MSKSKLVWVWSIAMWAWIYYGAVFTTVPIAEGCSWQEVLSAVDSAISGQWGGLTGCYLDGINYIFTFREMPFTLQ